MDPVKGRKLALVLIASFAFLGGVFDFAFRASSGMHMSYSIARVLLNVFLVFLWFYHDTDVMNYRRSAILNILVVSIGLIAIPYYLFRSRGAVAGFRAVALFFLAVACWFLLVLAGDYTGSLIVQAVRTT